MGLKFGGLRNLRYLCSGKFDRKAIAIAMIQRIGQIILVITLLMMLVIMGSSPALIHCNMAGTWKLSVFKMLDSQPAKTCCEAVPVEEEACCMAEAVEDTCCEAAPVEEETCCEATSENEMESCMEIVPMTIQPTITCDDNIEIPTPAEIVPLMALLGICIDNELLQSEQPQNRNLIDDHLIVPPRGILCHHCVLLC